MRRAPIVGGFVLALTLIFLVVFTPYLAGGFSAFAAKHGHVVEAVSGKGIAGAFVLTSAVLEAGPMVHGSTNKILYKTIVRTDADGGYQLPSQWSALSVAFPGSNPTLTWVVTAFVPGYVVVGDDDGWREQSNDQFPFAAKSATEMPSSVLSYAGSLEVAPLQLRENALTLSEATAYYRKIMLVGIERVEVRDPLEAELRSAAHGFFVSRICETHSDSAISMRTARQLMMFNVAQESAERRLQSIDPARWSSLSYSRALPDSAAEVCGAMHAGAP